MLKRISEFLGKNYTGNHPKNEEPSQNDRREELLTGGFVYKYPYVVDGQTIIPDNIKRLAVIIVNANTPQEKTDAEVLTKQVFDRELFYVMEDIRKKVMEGRKSKDS